MEMFERTFAMFAPFARQAGGPSAEPDKAASKSPDDIDDLKRQMEEMQKRLDRMSDKGQS
jgi:polyhydroxyalkanoate synthesis regulator protein